MEQREELAGYLQHLTLPASKAEVVHAAKKGGAPKDFWKMLDKQLPWITYQHLDDIVSALAAQEQKAR
jgi:hypothetical protein